MPATAPLPKSSDPRLDDVWARLATVSDPELDESVAAMGFVESVEISADDHVRIGLRLPTFCCAPNFAFLMAHDMREAVESLDWVIRAEITLKDHCYAEEINRGVTSGNSFAETFPGQATAELDELRVTFRRKAFQGRQEVLLRRLLADGIRVGQLCTMRIDDLAALELADADGALMCHRYLEIRNEFGGPAKDTDKAFTTSEGENLNPKNFTEYLKDLRRVRTNAAFNANMCRSVLQSRYGEAGE